MKNAKGHTKVVKAVVEQVTVDTGAFDPGEAFVPDATAEPDQPTAPVVFASSSVAKALRDGSGLVNGVVGEQLHADLTMTEFEAGLIAPGIVKYLAARPQLAATVAAGGNEYLQAAVGLGVYGVRVTRERAKAIEQMAEQPDAARGAAELQPDDSAAAPVYSIDGGLA